MASTIRAIKPPKNILIITGRPQHAAEMMTAPNELFWWADTHRVIAHNDNKASNASMSKTARYFENITDWCLMLSDSTSPAMLLNPFNPYTTWHKARFITANHRKIEIVNVKAAAIFAMTSFLLPSSVLKISGSIFVWLSSAKIVDTLQITSILPNIRPNCSISTNIFQPVV